MIFVCKEDMQDFLRLCNIMEEKERYPLVE